MLYYKSVLLHREREREREREKAGVIYDWTLATGASGDRAGTDLNRQLRVPEADMDNSPECLTIAASVFRVGKGVSPTELKERK